MESLVFELISTADSHYPNRTAWKDRELYKRLGWLSKGMPKWAKNTELPQGVEEIGYELFPKNGDQMWEAYKEYSQKAGVNMMIILSVNLLKERIKSRIAALKSLCQTIPLGFQTSLSPLGRLR